MKKIIISIFFLYVSINAFAQTRNILYKNDSVQIIHDLYMNKPFKGEVAIYPNTSLYYIVESNKNDTFCVAPSMSIGKSFYDGIHFSILIEYLYNEGQFYGVFEKQHGKWIRISQYFCHHPETGTIYLLKQKSLNEIEELISMDGKEEKFTLFLDFNKRYLTKYKLIENKKDEIRQFPFEN